MAIEASREKAATRRIRIGMVGGGQGAFIGAVHRIAMRIDDQYELVAGALSSDPARAKASAKELGIAEDRAYGSFEEMAKAEAKRPDGIEAVAIVTPNHMQRFRLIRGERCRGLIEDHDAVRHLEGAGNLHELAPRNG